MLFAVPVGKIAPLVGEIVLGSTNCPSQYPNNFKGWMDSVSVIVHVLSLSVFVSSRVRASFVMPFVSVQVSSCLSCPCKFRHAFRVRASFVMPFVSVQVSSCLSCPCISTYLMFPFMFCHASRDRASFVIPLVTVDVSSYLSCPCTFRHAHCERSLCSMLMSA